MKLVIHNGAREWRGNEKMTTILAEGLRERGHHVVVSCHPRGALRHRLEEREIPHVFRRPAGDIDVWSALRFSSWLRRERVDSVLLTTWKRIPWGSWAARRAGVARVVVRLGIARGLPDRWHYRLAFQRWVDAMVVNSPEIRSLWIESAPGFPAERVHLVLNGIRTQAAPAPGRLRRELGVQPDSPIVTGVGGLERRKGFDVLIEAVARIGARAHLVIAGSGSDGRALRDQADALGIGDRVHLLGQRDDIPAILADTDLFVLSSRNEGMAVAMLEAMAAGVPVVATGVSGAKAALAETADRGPAGWIVPVDDAPALAAVIERALAAIRAGTEAGERCEEARFRVREWFSEKHMIDRFEEILDPSSGRGAAA